MWFMAADESGTGALKAEALVRKVLASLPVSPGCRWGPDGTRLELRTEGIDVLDWDRASVIGAGEAVLAARVLLRSAGALSTVLVLPDGSRPDLVATIRVDGFAPASNADRALARGVAGGPFPVRTDPVRPWTELLTGLRSAARQEQSWLAVLDRQLPIGPRNRPSGPGAPSAAACLVIGSTLDVHAAWIRAGQAAGRVVSTAAASGVDLRPTVKPGEGQRVAIRARLGGGIWPQVLLGSG